MDTLKTLVRWIATAWAAIASTSLLAAPLVFEETTRIPSPDPNYYFPLQVAVEGDTIIATGVRFDGDIENHTAFLFQRRFGVWQFIRALATGGCDSGESAEDTCNGSVGIRNGVAVFAANVVHVFIRQPDGSWAEAPSDANAGPGDAAVGSGTVFAGESSSCYFATRAFRPNASGTWSLVSAMPGPSYPGCDHWGLRGSDIDASIANHVIVGSTPYDDAVQIHERSGSGWIQTAALTPPVDREPFGRAVAIDDTRAFISGSSRTPIHTYGREAGTWVHFNDILRPDSGQLGGASALVERNLVFAGFAGDRHRGGSVGVFRQDRITDEYVQVARLVRSEGLKPSSFLGTAVSAHVSGTFARVVAVDGGGSGGVYVFDLNFWGTTPQPQQEDFEQGAAANWTALAGSGFSVVTSAGSRVYRQLAVTGDAGSYVTSLDRTDQGIEADVKPTAFEGANRWVGLAVRRIDAGNYYYAALRQSNVLELKRMVNGAFTTLASTPVPVVLNRNYRLRIEAVGTLVRAYVDGELKLQARDTALTHGHAGVQMYRARADYDNVVLSPNPYLALVVPDSTAFTNNQFDVGPGSWSDLQLTQSSTAGDARAANFASANDQLVQTRVTANQFAAGAGSRWFGVMARYTDAGNYYYVTLRNDNTISLRKLVNGTIHVLDSAPFAVATGTAYTVRLEAIGSTLRAYVNGNVLLEASDSSHARGKYGPVMYKAAASYADFRAWEP